nr:helix-turn-helix domain-containing protein [Rubidibacter lacunae]
MAQEGHASQATQVASLLPPGRTRVTVSRWLRDYRGGGLSALTEPKPRSGRPPAISGDALAQLQQELQNERGFFSYVEVQTWLEAVWDLKLPYSTVHDTVRYRLGAKLKAPRPVDVKQDADAVDEF